MQGTKIVDASHDQETTDLHKCVDYIHDLTDVDKSNVGILSWRVALLANPVYIHWHWSLLWFATVVHTCSGCAWWKVWPWDWKRQCSMSFFNHTYNSYEWWLSHPTSPRYSSSWDSHPALCWGPSLWTNSYWDAISKYHNYWAPVGFKWVLFNRMPHSFIEFYVCMRVHVIVVKAVAAIMVLYSLMVVMLRSFYWHLWQSIINALMDGPDNWHCIGEKQ